MAADHLFPLPLLCYQPRYDQVLPERSADQLRPYSVCERGGARNAPGTSGANRRLADATGPLPYFPGNAGGRLGRAARS